MAESQLNKFKSHGLQPTSDRKAIVVGLYGVPGSGKSYLLAQLKQDLGETDFAFYEGSAMIDTVFPGGLKEFQDMEEGEKRDWRQLAIETIGMTCAENRQVAVVAGHFMFWSEGQEAGLPVYTEKDLETFTHILYLDVPADVVEKRCREDTARHRPSTSANHYGMWQQEEKTQLRGLCRNHGILFSLVSSSPKETTLLAKVSAMLRDFSYHTEKYNLAQAESKLDKIIAKSSDQLKTVLVMDADKTLAPQDTGTLFWAKVSNSTSLEYEASTLKALFSSPLKYTYTAFRQAVLLYEEAADRLDFDAFCQEVASAVTMHPEIVSLLQLVVAEEHVGAVVVTSGLRRVWDKVLEKEGLSQRVQVIGGGRIEDSLVVSAAVKDALVTRLREVHNMYVWAFGDSPLDLEMLRKADRAIVVVGELQSRSKTMDNALRVAIDSGGLRANQVVLPGNVTPRIDSSKLPLIKLTDPAFVNSLLGGQNPHVGLHVICSTDKTAAKLLATPMRDANVAGPELREAHRRVGHYLAIEYLADVIGIEQYPIRHVLGRKTMGYRLFHEQQTTIVALMRGGEPMALGVNDAFPLAMFVHANNPKNLKLHHLDGQITVILVDSVVNTGKTIIEFVQHVRTLHATIRIVVVAGVVQAQCVSESGLKPALATYGKVDLVTLRLSDTKFTGTGTTDTGNRLFNTTRLP